MDIISFSYGIMTAGATIVTAMSIHSFFKTKQLDKSHQFLSDRLDSQISEFFSHVNEMRSDFDRRIDHLGEVVYKIESEKEKKLLKS